MIDANISKRLKQAARTKNLFHRASELPSGSGILFKEMIRMEPWEIDYLIMVGKRVQHGVVELGRYNGGSTVVFAHVTNLPIYSIDISPQNDEKLVSLFNQCNVGSNVHLIVGDSQHVKYPEVKHYDLLFVDGDHSYQGCLNDLNNWWDGLKVGGHVLCHDSYFGNEVQDAIHEFLKDKQVNIYLSPYNPARHWYMPYGSLCHFQKLR